MPLLRRTYDSKETLGRAGKRRHARDRILSCLRVYTPRLESFMSKLLDEIVPHRRFKNPINQVVKTTRNSKAR